MATKGDLGGFRAVGGEAYIAGMIDHFGINCSDLEASARFYDDVLGVLGYSRQMDVGVAIGYGSDGHPQFY